MSASRSDTASPELVEPDQWVDVYGDYLYRFAISRLRDPAIAEELVQETFLAGIRFQDQYSGKGSQRGWLVTILKRKIIDYIRARARRKQTQLGDEETDPSGLLFDRMGHWKKDSAEWLNQPGHSAESQELWQIVRECMEELPDGQSAAFLLSVIEQMESTDICKELDISESNLWVRLHRARLKMANCVGTKWN